MVDARSTRRKSSVEDLTDVGVPGAYVDMMKGRVVEAPAFFNDPYELDEVSREFSEGLDMHVSTVDNVRMIFADAAMGQEYLDEKQFKNATLKILNAQESEVPRYRLQGFFQEALACSFSPGSPKGEKTSYTTTPTDRKVTVDKFMVWYRK